MMGGGGQQKTTDTPSFNAIYSLAPEELGGKKRNCKMGSPDKGVRGERKVCI